MTFFGAALIAGVVYGILGARDPGPDRLPAISFALMWLGFLPLPVVTAWQRLARRRMTPGLDGMINISGGLGLGSVVLMAGSPAVTAGERTLFAVGAVVGIGFVVRGALIWTGRITPGGQHPGPSAVDGLPSGPVGDRTDADPRPRTR